MLKAGIDTGNFAVIIEGNLKPEVQQEKLVQGVVYDLQRGGITQAWNTLGGVKGENGKTKLPEGFKRNSIEYSDDAALTMQGAVEEWAKGIFDGDFTVAVTKYEGAEEASPMKRATALVESFLGTEMEAPYRAILGLPQGSKEELVAEANKRGLGISVPKAAKKE